MRDDAPKKKVNTRGVLKVDGYSEFNPDMNVRLTQKGSVKKTGKKGKKCCKSE